MRILILPVILHFVIAPAFADEASDTLKRGILKAQKGDLGGAMIEFNQAIKLNPLFFSKDPSRPYSQLQSGRKRRAFPLTYWWTRKERICRKNLQVRQ